MSIEPTADTGELERVLGLDLRSALDGLIADARPAVFAVAGVDRDVATRLAPQVEAFFAEQGIPQVEALAPYQGELTATAITTPSWHPEGINELRRSLRESRKNGRCIFAILPGPSGRFAVDTYLRPFFQEGRNLILMDAS